MLGIHMLGGVCGCGSRVWEECVAEDVWLQKSVFKGLCGHILLIILWLDSDNIVQVIILFCLNFWIAWLTAGVYILVFLCYKPKSQWWKFVFY